MEVVISSNNLLKDTENQGNVHKNMKKGSSSAVTKKS